MKTIEDGMAADGFSWVRAQLEAGIDPRKLRTAARSTPVLLHRSGPIAGLAHLFAQEGAPKHLAVELAIKSKLTEASATPEQVIAALSDVVGIDYLIFHDALVRRANWIKKAAEALIPDKPPSNREETDAGEAEEALPVAVPGPREDPVDAAAPIDPATADEAAS